MKVFSGCCLNGINRGYYSLNIQKLLLFNQKFYINNKLLSIKHIRLFSNQKTSRDITNLNIKNSNKDINKNNKNNNKNEPILLYKNKSLKARSRLLTICNMVGYSYWGTYAMPLLNPAWSLPQSPYDDIVLGVGLCAQTIFLYYCHLYTRRNITEIVLLEDRKLIQFTTLDLLGNTHSMITHRDEVIAKPRFDRKAPGTVRFKLKNNDKHYVIDRLNGDIYDYERLGSILSIRLMDFIQ